MTDSEVDSAYRLILYFLVGCVCVSSFMSLFAGVDLFFYADLLLLATHLIAGKRLIRRFGPVVKSWL